MVALTLYSSPLKIGAGCHVTAKMVGAMTRAHSDSLSRPAYFVFVIRAPGCRIGFNLRGRSLVEKIVRQHNQSFPAGSEMRTQIEWSNKSGQTEFVLTIFDERPESAARRAKSICRSVRRAIEGMPDNRETTSHFTVRS